MASFLKPSTQKYTRSQIFNCGKPEYYQTRNRFAQLLQISPTDPNLLSRIYQILSWANLIIPDKNSHRSLEFSFLPLDILRLIAIHLDCHDLTNYCSTNTALAEIYREETFWLDKIDHDFGLSPTNRIALITDSPISFPKRYLLEAINHHCPIAGVENYAYSYRHHFMLIFNAAKSGKTATRLIERIRLYGDMSYGFAGDLIDEPDFLTSIGNTIYNKAKTINLHDKHSIVKGAIVGAIIINNQEIIHQIKSQIEEEDFHFCYNIAVTILDRPDLLSNINYQDFNHYLEFLLDYAMLFNSRKIIEYMINMNVEIDNILTVALARGTKEMFEFLYQKSHTRDKDNLLDCAELHGNLPIVKKLIELKASPSLNIDGHLKITPPLWKLMNLSTEKLNNYLYCISDSQQFDVVELLVDLGADSLDDAISNIQTHNTWMAKLLTKLKASIKKVS